MNRPLFISLLLCLCILLAPQMLAQAFDTPGTGDDEGKTVLYRDTWGVPHIYAPTANDGLYAMGWAQAQDRPDQLLENIARGLGESSKFDGRRGIQADLRSLLFDHYGVAQRNFDQIDPPVQEQLRAFTRGMNDYYDAHPEDVPEWWGDRDIDPYMIIAFGRLFLYNWSIDDAYGDLERGGIRPGYDREQRGSNQWSVSPKRSATGSAILYIDPHLSWWGPSRFWEFRMHAGELVGSGFSLPGSPYIGLGHNENVGWAMTTGGPDTADIYELTLKDDDPTKYMYDGEWRSLESREVTVEVKDGEAQKQTLYQSHLGPIVAIHGNKAYAAAMAYGEIVELNETWYQMNIAKDYKGVEDALASATMFPQNVMVADTSGNIYYQRTGRVPIRPDGYDWSKPVAGDNSKSAWIGVHPTADLVQILNPEQGYMENCNIPPDAMMINSPLTPDKYKDYIYGDLGYGPQGGWSSQRGARAVELLSKDDSVTIEEALQYAVDMHPYGVERWIEGLRAAHEKFGPEFASNADYTAGMNDLLAWNQELNAASTGALKYYYWREQLLKDHGDAAVEDIERRADHPEYIAQGKSYEPATLSDEEMQGALSSFANAMAALKEHFGSLDATYGDKFRVGRDDKSWPLGGGGGNLGITTLRNVGFGQEKPDHTRWGQSGQTSTQIVVMSKPIQSWTYVPIGQSDRPASPHYSDQAEKLFSPAVLKSTWWTPEALYAHIESREALHPEAAAPPAAAGDVAEILGIWKLTMELQGNQVPATMVLSEQDGKLAGTWEDTFGKDDLYDIVYRGNALTLGRDVTYQGQDYAIDFEGKIADGVLKGTFFTDAGPLEVEGSREGVAAPAAPAIAGTWDALVEFEGEQHPSKMTVTQNADGSYSVAISDEYGAQPPYDVTFENNTLGFKRKVEYQGETPEITFEAKIEGDTLTGEYTTEIGTLPVKAARVAAPAEAAAPAPAGDVQAALGTWELSIEIQGSSFPATLTLTQGADGALVGAWQDQYSTTPPDNVAFKEGTLTFTRKVPYQGQEYTLQFEGKIAGDALTGEFSTGTFVMPATGKRAAAAPSTPAPEAPAPAPATGIQSLLGEWEGKMEYQGSHYPAKMSFSQGADGALTGTWADEFTTKPPYDITFENGTLTFSRTLDYQGTEYTLEFEGKVEGDTIMGEFSTDVGPIPLTATRAAAAASAPAPAPEPAPAVPAPAAADISALVGDWAVTIEFQGSSFPASMSFTQAASGALEGAWKDEYSTTAPYDIKFENGALSFARKIEYQGQEYTITFEGKLDGDTITGEYETEMGPLPVTAKRVATPGAPPAASADTFLGDWDVAVDIQGSALPAKLGIAQGADGQLSGTWSDEYSSTAPYNVRVAEGKLQFDRKVEVQGQEYVIAFEGAVEGDTLTGAYHTEMGDLPVTGKRAAAPSPAAADSGLPGEWNITTVSQLGTLERTLLIAPDLSGWYGVDERRFPLQNLKQDGKKLVFDVTVSVQGTEVPLHFEGEADSGKISGVFSTPYGNATVTGTKKATEAAAGDASGEVRQVLEQWKKAMEAGELDQAMTFYSNDFTSTEGGDKAGTRDYLQSAKDSGYLDGLKIALEDTEVAVDGDTATIKNIAAEGGFGAVTLNFTAKKQDGKWLITEQQ